jgi:hypothetical protein
MCKESWRDDLRVVRTSREPREHGRLGRAGTGVEKMWRVMRGEFSKNGTPPRRVPNFQLNSGVSAGLGVHWQVPSRASGNNLWPAEFFLILSNPRAGRGWRRTNPKFGS